MKKPKEIDHEVIREVKQHTSGQLPSTQDDIFGFYPRMKETDQPVSNFKQEADLISPGKNFEVKDDISLATTIGFLQVN